MSKRRSIREQAQAVISSKTSIKGTRAAHKEEHTLGNFRPVQSLRSAKEAALALGKIASDLDLKRIKHLDVDTAKQWLQFRKESLFSQKTLDRDRKALSLALGVELPRVRSISDKYLTSRAYTSTQISLITESLSQRNALAVQIAYRAGLRTHELLTISRADEAQRTGSRTWTDERFAGREGVLYLVTGKGGLVREVMIPSSLATELESRRLAESVLVKDRGINYQQHYDIGGGHALSQAFSDASKRTLGYSHGIHGVRHKYAQERIDEVKYYYGLNHESAREIVAQELGHFRGDITETYLR